MLTKDGLLHILGDFTLFLCSFIRFSIKISKKVLTYVINSVKIVLILIYCILIYKALKELS
jgi:hypothetical protein